MSYGNNFKMSHESSGQEFGDGNNLKWAMAMIND